MGGGRRSWGVWLSVGVFSVTWWAAWEVLFGQTSPESAADQEAEAPALVYRGEPIVVPLECGYEDLLNAGMVCNEDAPCRLFLELVAVQAGGGKTFALGNIHSASATVTSILLVSDDQGVTWREELERIRGATLELILFLDNGRGWIGGQRWELTTEARPFLLLTTNGGDRWEQRELWTGDSDRPGVISAFDFEDDGHGFLVVERLNSDTDPFELYETMNGGRSWGIRGITSDRPAIPIKRLTSREPLWRLQSDHDHGAYTIERLVEGAWTLAASFSSSLGTCHSMDRKEEERRSPSQRLD